MDRYVAGETSTNLWNLWWFRYALVNLHQSPFNCTFVFYPFGANLWYHTLAPLPAVVGALLQPLVGLVATGNVLVLASFLTSGLAAAALARHLGISRGAAVLAGSVYAFSPAVLAHLYVGHFELLWTCFMPATLLMFLRLAEPGCRRPWTLATLLGVLLVAATYTSAYYAVYSVELICVAAVVRWRQVVRVPCLRPLALAILLTVVGTAPQVMAFASLAQELPSADAIRRDFTFFRIEPTALFVPSFTHPVLSPWLRSAYDELNREARLPQETTAYLGYTVLGLSIAAMVMWRRKRNAAGRSPASGPEDWRLMAVIAATFLVLSFGSELKIVGFRHRLPMPASMLADVPILRQARAPSRHIVVAMLGFALLASACWQRLPRRSWRGVLALAMAFEYWPAVPMMATTVAPVYQRLADEQGNFAVLDVPLSVRDGNGKLGGAIVDQNFAQTVHHKPIVGGMVSRLPDATWKAIASAPVIRSLLDPEHAAPALPAESAAYFAKWNIRAIVIHPEASAAERRLIETSLPIDRREHFADGIELWWLK
jgi:hypothetical protein